MGLFGNSVYNDLFEWSSLGKTRINHWSLGCCISDDLMYHDVSANLRHPSPQKSVEWGSKNCRDIIEPNSWTVLEIYKILYTSIGILDTLHKNCPSVG